MQNTNKLLVLFLVCGFMMIGCKENPSRPENGVLQGVVYNSVTNATIGNTIFYSSGDSLGFSNFDGEYSLNLEIGECEITCSAGGHESKTNNFLIENGQTENYDFYLTPLIPNVMGIVTHSNTGNAIPGALINDGTTDFAVSGIDGSYSFEIVAGIYTFTCSAVGYFEQEIIGVEIEWGDTVYLNFQLIPVTYIITSMTAIPNVIYSDGNEATFSTVQVIVTDSDNFAVIGQPIQFITDRGYLIPDEAITDSSGIATVAFHDGNALGFATIEAIIGNTSESILIYIDDEPPPDVSSIEFDVSDQIMISVQGTGGLETYELVASLYDSSGQLLNQPKTVWFELLTAPEGTNINDVGLIDSTTSIAGKAYVNINSGEHSGNVTCRVSTENLDGVTISATKSNIVVASGLAHTVEFSISGNNSGANMGNGVWKVQISALLNDIDGNPVAPGTAVWFSLPDNPEWASVIPQAYVNNQNAMGDSLPGVAYTYLNYNGSHTNETIILRIETGVGDIFEGELVLPIQFPVIDIAAIPMHVDWYEIPYPTPEYQSTEIRITLHDGQNNPIDNQVVIFSTSLGEPLEPYPPDTGDPYTGLTGVVDEEHGRLNKEVQFYFEECPPPIPSPPGTTTGSITAQILGTGVSNQVTVILRRYVD